MKNFFWVLSAIFIFQGVSAQNDLFGHWGISSLIGMNEAAEYRLYKTSAGGSYGNGLYLKEDGTFISAYSAECGNDCFTSNFGRFKMVDAEHVHFYLDSVNVTGDCPHRQLSPKKDLGIYAIVKEEKGYKLIKSNGSESDRQKLAYSKLMDAFEKETGDAPNLYYLPFKPVAAKTDIGIVKEVLAGNTAFDVRHLKVLYSREMTQGYFRAILFEHSGQNYFVAYIVHSGYAALYDSKLKKKAGY
jgi:hypothetical protein